MLTRFKENPLISPSDVKPSRPDFEVMCAFNAGAALHRGQTVLLVRVAERPQPERGYVSTAFLDPAHPDALKVLRIRLKDPQLDFSDPRFFMHRGRFYLTSISHLRLATSADGHAFTVAPVPALRPEFDYEEYGIEDPRICRLNGWFYVNYSAISRQGVVTALARTRDFVSYEKLGIIFCPDNKDIALFPEKINGRYYCFHRPSMKQIGAPSMWLASSPNLRDWGQHRFIMGPRPGAWDSERVGCGASPVKTPHGWLQIYHGANEKVCYCSGAVLLDLQEPWKVLARSDTPLFRPQAPYERRGLMPNVVFSNGLVPRSDGLLDVYYGAADTTTCGLSLDLNALLATLK